MTKHLTSMRLSQYTKAMINRMSERTGDNATEIVSTAILLMWLVSGGGKYAVDPIALGMQPLKSKVVDRFDPEVHQEWQP